LCYIWEKRNQHSLKSNKGVASALLEKKIIFNMLIVDK